jgi:hypothetical protein
MAKFLYYRHDGAYYRRPADAVGIAAHDILRGGEWAPYEAEDPTEPVAYGSRVDEAEINEALKSEKAPA